jgi:hypothetical protein
MEISLPHTFVRPGDTVVCLGRWYRVTRVDSFSGVAFGIRISR